MIFDFKHPQTKQQGIRNTHLASELAVKQNKDTSIAMMQALAQPSFRHLQLGAGVHHICHDIEFAATLPANRVPADKSFDDEPLTQKWGSHSKVQVASLFGSSRSNASNPALPPFGPISTCGRPHSLPLGGQQISSVESASSAPTSSCGSVWGGVEMLVLMKNKRGESATGCLSAKAEEALENISMFHDRPRVEAAAHALANLALRPDAQTVLSQPKCLDILADSCTSHGTECVGRFLAMAVGRMATNKAVAPLILAHDALLKAMLSISISSGGEWKQGARALAVLAARAPDDESSTKLLRMGALAPILELSKVNQTELQAEALCALAAWCKVPENVIELSRGGAWLRMLETSYESKSVACIGALCSSVLTRALDSAPHDVHLCPAALHLLLLQAACDKHRIACGCCDACSLGAGSIASRDYKTGMNANRQAFSSLVERLGYTGESGVGRLAQVVWSSPDFGDKERTIVVAMAAGLARRH